MENGKSAAGHPLSLISFSISFTLSMLFEPFCVRDVGKSIVPNAQCTSVHIRALYALLYNLKNSTLLPMYSCAHLNQQPSAFETKSFRIK